MADKCTSCNKEVVNDKESTSFTCPNCGKVDIIRCGQCRKLATRYICKGCGFSGPN